MKINNINRVYVENKSQALYIFYAIVGALLVGLTLTFLFNLLAALVKLIVKYYVYVIGGILGLLLLRRVLLRGKKK